MGGPRRPHIRCIPTLICLPQRERDNSDGHLYYHTKDRMEDREDIDRFVLDEGADIYADGSCFDGTLRTAHAGMAIVQQVSGYWKIIGYTLPEYLDQSAAFAEATALLICIRHMRQGGSYTVVSDCMAVVRGWAKILAKKPLSPNAVNAGIWRQIRDEANKKDLKIQLRKVKAHRTTSEVPAAEMKDWLGNEKADEHAKFAAKLGKWTDKVLEEEVLKSKVDKLLMQHGLERAKCAYEQGGDFIRKRPRKAQAEGDEESDEDFTTTNWAGQHGGHWLHYAPAEGRVKCGACGLTFGSLKKATGVPCKGGRTALLKACEAQHAKGHALYACASDKEEVIVFCARCGHYASKQCIKLSRQCEGSAARTKHKKRTVNNILKGVHPEPNKSHIGVGPIWRLKGKPLCQPEEAVPMKAAASNGDHLIELAPEADENNVLAQEVKDIGELEEAEAAARQAEDPEAQEDEDEAMQWALDTWDQEAWGGGEALTPPPAAKRKRRRIRGKTTDHGGLFAAASYSGVPPPPYGGEGMDPV